MNIPIIYEDNWLLIVDKPAGLLTIPTPKNEKRTLTSILNDDLKERGLSYRLHPSHRLDRETSGLIIYAKGKAIQKKMMDEFKNRRIKKIYLAFVQKQIAQAKGSIGLTIEGLSALTHYRVLEKRKDFSVVEVLPFTGRKNQIRIHFKKIGHPLVGESRFAFRKDFALRAKRALLHAISIEFTHPVTQKLVSVKAPLPPDMQKLLRCH